MARISVKEKDLSWYYRQRERGALTVYMPGLSIFGPSTPTYVTEDNFARIFGGPIGYKKDYSYYIASSLLKSGIDVLFHRVISTGATKAHSEIGSYVVTIDNKKESGYSVIVVNNTENDLQITITEDGVEKVYVFNANATTTHVFDPTYKSVVDTALAAATAGAEEGQYEISKEDINNDLVIEVNGVTYTFPAGEVTTEEFDISDKDQVDEALSEYETSSDYVITKEDNSAELVAKYEGSLGNDLVVKVYYNSTVNEGIRYLYTYYKDTIVEQLIVDFKDPLSQYYYQNIESGYLDFSEESGFNAETFLELTKSVSENGLNIALNNGKDYGDDVDPIEDAVDKMTAESFFDELKNPYGYYFDILVNGDLVVDDDTKNKSVDKNLASVAEVSGMSVYLTSGKYASDSAASSDFYNYCADFNSSFAAGIGPWSLSQLVATGIWAWLPGWYAQLVEWGNSISKGNPVWYAPAGVNRARVGSVIRKTAYEIGKTVLDLWQNQSETSPVKNSYKLNPIMNLKQYGYCINGNSTLLHSKPDGSTSMLQSLGTRILVNKIKSKAFDVALSLQFDQLSDNLFMAFKVEMGAYMDQIKYQGGLYDYQIVLDRTTVTFDDLNQRKVPVKIRISPNPAAENFDILCEVYPSGITFTDEFDEFSVQNA